MDNTPKQTPMGKVWMVVLGTMLFTVVGSYIWHLTTLERLKMDNAHENNMLRLEIKKLTDYRDTLVASTTPAAGKETKVL
jgi:hypothetical protein